VSIVTEIAAALAVLILIYLFIALLKPEIFT
jgi:K+-transporting ATPase KdpF subunit